MPDLNGRRYETYLMAAQLTDLAGQPLPHLRQRAEELKAVLKRQLWNERVGWFEFQNDKGQKDLRLTVQMFKLFGSKVLDAEQEAGLLRHLTSEREFLAKFGVRAEFNGDLRIDPHPPAFSPKTALKGLRLRGHVLDITVDRTDYEVSEGNNRIRVPIGRPVLLQGGKLLVGDAVSGSPRFMP